MDVTISDESTLLDNTLTVQKEIDIPEGRVSGSQNISLEIREMNPPVPPLMPTPLLELYRARANQSISRSKKFTIGVFMLNTAGSLIHEIVKLIRAAYFEFSVNRTL